MINDAEWDQWNDLNDPPTPPAPDDDDDLPLDPPTPDPLDDDDIVIPPVSPKPDDDDDPADPSEPPADGNTNMSGIELYLSQFDIEGGMIDFEDGTSVHFDELDPERQAEVLQQLHGSNATSVEEQYGLDENEIGMINYLRANNLTVDQLLENMATERVNAILARQQSTAIDYQSMTPDAIYMAFLSKSNPEATTEQLEEDLRIAKAASNYERITTALKDQFVASQQAEITAAQAQEAAQREQELDEQRRLVVDTVRGINDIAGIQVTDDVKNSLLDRVLEVNDDGDSVFLSEVFSDPTKLFNAAFWYYYGEDIARQKDEYWKKEKSQAYKRGRQDALGNGEAPNRRSFTNRPDPTQRNARQSEEDNDDWNTLHNN